jgi:hypothetical protein
MAAVVEEEVITFLGTIDKPIDGCCDVFSCGHPLGMIIAELPDVRDRVAEIHGEHLDEGIGIIDAAC